MSCVCCWPIFASDLLVGSHQHSLKYCRATIYLTIAFETRIKEKHSVFKVKFYMQALDH